MTWRPPVDEKALRNKVEEAMQTLVENLAHLGAKDPLVAAMFRGAREFQEEIYQHFHGKDPVLDAMQRREDFDV